MPDKKNPVSDVQRSKEEERILKGGWHYFGSKYLRIDDRFHESPDMPEEYTFRIVKNAPRKKR